MIRMTPKPGTPVDPDTLSSVDAIVQARIDKRISRRQLIERAGQLGIGAAVTAIMLRAAGEAQAAPGGSARGPKLLGQEGGPIPVEGPTAPE
jgi:hypothetical protein